MKSTLVPITDLAQWNEARQKFRGIVPDTILDQMVRPKPRRSMGQWLASGMHALLSRDIGALGALAVGAIDVLPFNQMSESNRAPAFFHAKVLASPAIVNTIVCTEQSITVTGLAAGDLPIGETKPTINGAIALVRGRVSAANTWKATFCNPTAGNVTPTATEVYDLLVYRPAA